MPRIEEYTAPSTLLRPDREGFLAYETQARRLGPLYNDVATALREGGAAKARGITDQARVTALITALANPPQRVSHPASGGGGEKNARQRGNQPERIADAANKLAGMAHALATPYEAAPAQGVSPFGTFGKSLAQKGYGGYDLDTGLPITRRSDYVDFGGVAQQQQDTLPFIFQGDPRYAPYEPMLPGSNLSGYGEGRGAHDTVLESETYGPPAASAQSWWQRFIPDFGETMSPASIDSVDFTSGYQD